ncbi:MAG TPA: MFS transporter [Nocardioidaceae bacterium]|nr:MFS transporter [Nocardioidaceae bacterium]
MSRSLLPRRLRLGGFPGGLAPDVLVMAAVALCVALGFGVVGPAITLFAETFGVGATAAGAVVSVFALMRLASDLGAGRLVDAIGVRTCLVAGIAVVAVSSLLAGLAQSYVQLLVLRGVGGLGSAMFGVAAISVVLKVSTAHNRGRAMSVYRSGFLLGGILGPAVGSGVLVISLRAPFFLYAGTLVLAGTVAVLFLGRRDAAQALAAADQAAPSTRKEESGGHGVAGTPEPTLRSLMHTTQYQTALMANLAVGVAVFGLRSAIIPLFIVKDLGASRSWVAIAFLVSALVQTALMFPAGRWADVAGRRPALLSGAAVSAAGLLLLGFTGSLAVALAAMAVFGAGSAFLGSVPGALVGDVAGRRSGTVVAVFNMASDLGAVVGPTLAGWLVDRGSYEAAFVFGAAVIAVAGLVGLRLPRGAMTSG